MNSQQMYINPAIISVCVAIFMALLAIGGILWKGAGLLGDLRRDVAVISERLDSHIKACEPRRSQTHGR